MSTNFSLLLVDDDSLVADSLRLVIPKNWKMTVSTRAADVPKDGFFHAAMIDQHLTGNLQHAEGTEVIKTVRARFPKTEIVPPPTRVTPVIMLIVVLLPAPLGPSKPKISPGWISRERLFTTVLSP